MTDKEIDEIYNTACYLMNNEQWSMIDDLLEWYGMSAWRRDLDLLLSWATVTNTHRSKLKNRKWFMEQCLKFHDDPEDPQLWKGLYEEDTDPIADLKMLGL